MTAKLLVVLVASFKLAFNMFIVALIIGALMLIPFGFYKSNGGKKTYFKYCGIVFVRLFNLINEGIEHIFSIKGDADNIPDDYFDDDDIII